jgi:hypothetical protein
MERWSTVMWCCCWEVLGFGDSVQFLLLRLGEEWLYFLLLRKSEQRRKKGVGCVTLSY